MSWDVDLGLDLVDAGSSPILPDLVAEAPQYPELTRALRAYDLGLDRDGVALAETVRALLRAGGEL